ncbi:MAG: hypothetical protein GXO47_04860 [Chlorobi bacterium]|nr:hypothetical protein [Chlorobiota bacterium]
MNTIKYLLTALFFILIFNSLVNAQVEQDILKKQKEDREKFEREKRKDFDNFKKQYEEGLKKLDKEFKDYLKQEWKRYELFKAEQLYSEPKPETVPEYRESVKKEPEEKDIVLPEKAEPAKLPDADKPPVLSLPEDPGLNGSTYLSFGFYGANVSVPDDTRFRFHLAEEINETTISEGWEDMAGSFYNNIPAMLFNEKERMMLNDWGYYLLVKDYSENVSNNRNERVFVQWFLLLKSGFKVKLAYENSNLFLLLPSLNTIYEMPYFIFDGLRFYLVEGEVNNIYTYERDYPEATRVVSLELEKPVSAGNSVLSNELSFRFNGKNYNLNIQYNRNAIDFYRDYPLANVEVYFDAAVSSVTRESLKRELAVTAEMSEIDAVSLLLHFVQTAFEYETDQEQFGREKVFFPDELFYYPASDCEDRAVLFSYLVRELTGLDVLGIEYPGHMATAVRFHGNVGGDFIVYNGNKYIICDPTYINAPIGVTMPEYAVSKVKPIELKRKSR